MKHGISIIARAMLTIALLLVGSQVAYAQPSPDTLQNFEHRDVELTLQTGESLQVYVQSVGENFLVTLDADGVVEAWPFQNILRIELRDVPSATMPHNSYDAPAMAPINAQLSREAQIHALEKDLDQIVRSSGQGLLISGGFLLAIGMAIEALGVLSAVAAAQGARAQHDEDWGTGIFVLGAVTFLPIGAALLGTGAGLVVAGSGKRKRTRNLVYGRPNYSVSPTFARRGGGAQFRLEF